MTHGGNSSIAADSEAAIGGPMQHDTDTKTPAPASAPSVTELFILHTPYAEHGGGGAVQHAKQGQYD